MEIVIEPDMYSPNIDDHGNYIDYVPSFHTIKKGIRCPCGSRKDKLYETTSIFSSHIKTKTHQKWLSTLNQNKSNFYVENIKLKETIQNQILIIGRLEKDLNTKLLTIDYLTNQLVGMNKKCIQDVNLLDFD